MVEAGFLHARAGKVRLLRREELDEEWTPAGDKRRTVWEDVQQLIRALDARGEDAAAGILAQLTGAEAESARDLAYRLYTLCERKGWAQEAIAYNGLVVTWPELQRRAHDLAAPAAAGPAAVEPGFQGAFTWWRTRCHNRGREPSKSTLRWHASCARIWPAWKTLSPNTSVRSGRFSSERA